MDNQIVNWSKLLKLEQERRGISHVALLSDDINMRSIAISHGVPAKPSDFIKERTAELVMGAEGASEVYSMFTMRSC